MAISVVLGHVFNIQAFFVTNLCLLLCVIIYFVDRHAIASLLSVDSSKQSPFNTASKLLQLIRSK